ncbi:OsmC family protein [bacterium]|nr:OsmC family protein [bacterium]
MTVVVTKMGAMLSLGATRGHQVKMDVPKVWNGEDGGMTPTELFAAAVGGCSQFFLTKYLLAKGIDPKGTVVEVDYEMDERQTRITTMTFKIRFGESVPEEMKKGAGRAASRCILHTTLENSPALTTSW